MKIYRLFWCILWLVVRLCFRYRIVDKPKGLEKEKLIICCNHQSMWDIVAVAVAYPQPIHFVAKKELLRNPLFRFLGRVCQIVFIDREEIDMDAMREIRGYLKKGEAICIFPEGTRVKSVDPANMKEGTSFLASRSKADILPLYIEADYHCFRGRVEVHYRERLKNEDYQQYDRREVLDILSCDIFNRIYDTDYPLEDFQRLAEDKKRD